MAKFRDDVINMSVTWADVHRDTKRLAHQVMGRPWKGVVALARGGLVPAAIIARELNLRLIETLCIATYDEQVLEKVSILKTPEQAAADQGEGWLLIDDLVDTGTTAKAAREILPQAYFATVYAKPAGRPVVDAYVGEVSQDTWVYFPWDTEPQYAPPLADR